MATTFLVGLISLGLAPAPATTSADSLTLRDGKVLLGQILDSDRRGPLQILVRRGWLAKNLPERLAQWEKLEAPSVKRAELLRRERLEAWKRDRRAVPVESDRITPWIEGELAHLANPNRDASARSTLMVVKLARTEVKGIDRKSRASNRLLRLGWLSDFPEVETLSEGELTQALEGRGFSATSDLPVSVESLLPTPLEDDAHWLLRRGSTEIVNDPGGRLLRYQGMVMAEPLPGEPPPAGAALNAALGGLKELLGEAPPADPLPARLREFAGQGRVGVVVTRLEMAPDLASTTVETTLWIRLGDRWNPAISRTSTVGADDLPPDAANGLGDDPQVKAVFGIVESLGLGDVSPEIKRRTLTMGAATRKALGLARGALDRELNATALPLEIRPAPRP